MNSQDEFRDLWCSQPLPPRKGEDMLAIVMERSRLFERQIASRNLREIIAALFVFVACGFIATRVPSPLEKVGMSIVAASGAWIAWYVWRRGTGPSAPDGSADLSSYEALLLENYDHQIRLLRTAKFWYVMPPYCGLLLSWIGHAIDVGWNALIWADYLNIAIFTCVFAAVWVANEVYGVRHLRRLKSELAASMENGREL